MKKTEKIIITCGDPAGIGHEIAIKSILDPQIKQKITPILIGNLEILKSFIPKIYAKKINFNILKPSEKIKISDDKNCLNIINFDFPKNYKFKFGKSDKITGKFAFLYLEKALELIKTGEISKLVTAPISKKSWQDAGIKYQAHTEALAELTNTKKYAMIFANSELRVVLATRHVEIKNIINFLDKKTIEDAIDSGLKFLKNLRIRQKSIGICGLNPHAGEEGSVGKEEIEIIQKVLRYKKYEALNFYGPKSSDDVFHRALEKKLDLVVAMYHDQGILPLKITDYFGCVNITIGLPFVRVSPGHGTAFDIAGQNTANPRAMIEAILWALKLNV